MYETLEVSQDGSVAWVYLNRPEVRNAFNASMIDELSRLFAGLGSRDDVRLVVIAGRGRAFSAGADVNWMRSSLDFSTSENFEDASRMSDMFHAIASLPQPVIASVHGAALGGGMGLIAACDIAVAADDCVFGFTETKLGIIPAVISRFVLPKIGESWARALYLTGERFGTDVARQIGLIHWVVSPDQLDAVVQDKVNELLSAGPRAVVEAKGLIHGLAEMDPEGWKDFTATLIASLRTAPEGQEGLRAFLEKRRPAWSHDSD